MSDFSSSTFGNSNSIRITLTAEESAIFDVLKCAMNEFNQTTVIRIAGGWVRDKILGLPSDDIDVAIDDCSGVDFANMVNEYMKKNNLEVHTIGIISANPEQSKHLETANLRIFNNSIDCVNLRAESYTTTSRIPTIRFGTPLEDSLRRDFTINALFYNVTSELIEDFTGKGINDLNSGIIRTPLDPNITFTDDPLRILRAIRFASRYGFQLDFRNYRISKCWGFR